MYSRSNTFSLASAFGIAGVLLAGCAETPTAPGFEVSAAESKLAPAAAPAPAISDIVIDLPKYAVKPGERMKLTARLLPSGEVVPAGQVILWRAMNVTRATVDLTTNEIVGGKYTGPVVLIVRYDHGKWQDSVTMMVGTEAPSIAAQPAAVSLAAGTTRRLTVGGVKTGQTARFVSTNPAVATVATDGTVTAMKAGVAAIRVTVGDESVTSVVTVTGVAPTAGPAGAAGATSSTSTSTSTSTATSAAAGPAPVEAAGVQTRPAATKVQPTLPRKTVDTRMPAATGRTFAVKANGDVQAAIDSAKPGDVITLQAGATFKGNFRLRPKTGNGWIVIRTSAADASLPAQGTRVSPTRHKAALARIESPNADAAIRALPGARGYRLVGLEITTSAGVTGNNGLVNFGLNSTEYTTVEALPGDLILDRSWVHGTATLNVKRCLTLNGGSSAVVDSYLSDCHAKGQDSQAIVGWSGTGPYKIENNYLEGAGENVMFGGAPPYIQGVIPADIVIRRNHFSKPESWKGLWTVKNILELKFAQRVLIEENVLENSWIDAQTGFAILLKTSTDAKATWVITEDVTIRNNVVRNSAAGIAIAANPDRLAKPARRILVEGNLFHDIGVSAGTTNGRMLQITDDIADLSIVSNTMLPSNTKSGITFSLESKSPGKNLFVASNIFQRNAYGIAGSGKGSGIAAFNAHWESYTLSGNLMVGFTASEVPAGNLFAKALADVGFANLLSGDFRLTTASLFRSVGADVAGLTTMATSVTAR